MRIVVGAKVAARRTRAMEVEVARRSLRMMGEPQGKCSVVHPAKDSGPRHVKFDGADG